MRNVMLFRSQLDEIRRRGSATTTDRYDMMPFTIAGKYTASCPSDQSVVMDVIVHVGMRLL